MEKRIIEIELDEEDFKYCKEFCEKYKFDLGFGNFCSYALKLFAVLFRAMEKRIAEGRKFPQEEFDPIEVVVMFETFKMVDRIWEVFDDKTAWVEHF